MMELHENIDEALLLLYFSGTLGEKEKEEVENWISLSEENRKIRIFKTCLHFFIASFCADFFYCLLKKMQLFV